MLNEFSIFESRFNNKNSIRNKIITNNFFLYKKLKPVLPKINVLNSLSYKNNYETTISSNDSKLLIENKLNNIKINKNKQNFSNKLKINSFSLNNKSFKLNKKSLFDKKLNNIKLNKNNKLEKSDSFLKYYKLHCHNKKTSFRYFKNNNNYYKNCLTQKDFNKFQEKNKENKNFIKKLEIINNRTNTIRLICNYLSPFVERAKRKKEKNINNIKKENLKLKLNNNNNSNNYINLNLIYNQKNLTLSDKEISQLKIYKKFNYKLNK